MKTEIEANRILEAIAWLAGTIEKIEAVATQEMEAIRSKYSAEVERLSGELKAREKDLVALMKKNRASLFDGVDKVKLEAGILLYGKELKVSIPRDALSKVEELGYHEAIRIAKSLDRAVVEAWPDERLFMIGARRKQVEKFDYELSQ